jgi:hypothetical protein
LWLSSVLRSRQIQHSLNAAAAVTAAVVVVAGLMAAEAAASMVAAEHLAVEDIVVAADLMAVESLVVAATEAARDLMVAEEVATQVGLELAAISARPEIGRRTFVPQSTMASGIRSATPVVPHV